MPGTMLDPFDRLAGVIVRELGGPNVTEEALLARLMEDEVTGADRLSYSEAGLLVRSLFTTWDFVGPTRPE